MTLNLNGADKIMSVRLAAIHISHSLPLDVTMHILGLMYKETMRELNREKNLKEMFNGTSKSAAKRRAAFLGRCYKCGKLSHTSECSRNQTDSNHEFLNLIKFGTNRSLVENVKSMRKDSYSKIRAAEMISKHKDAVKAIKLKEFNSQVNSVKTDPT